MEALEFARLQFGSTTIYHFFFVPVSIGLAPLVAIFHTQYVRTGQASPDSRLRVQPSFLTRPLS